MKKILLLIPLTILAFSGCVKEKEKDVEEKEKEIEKEEFLAPTTPQKRVAVLEDFTGVRCGYCPDGHVRAKAIEDANPDKFIVIGVHGGGYAAPQPGWANFTTPYAQELINQALVSGYPAGTVSRIKCSELGVQPQKANGYAMSRGSWAAAATKVFGMDAPVNLGAKVLYDESTRKLTIKVDLYYTSSENEENRLNIAILQDNLTSKQSGGGDNYTQHHNLRDFITGQWGEVISESKETGSKISKTFIYDVPEDYNGPIIPPGGGKVVIQDLKIVAFVSRGKTDILNAIKVSVK